MALISMHEFAESAGLKQTFGVLKSGRDLSKSVGATGSGLKQTLTEGVKMSILPALPPHCLNWYSVYAGLYQQAKEFCLAPQPEETHVYTRDSWIRQQ